MRILLDECVPRRFRRELPEHEIQTVPEMGWASFENGALLSAASGKFDVLVTTDQRFGSRQDVSKLSLAVVVLVPGRTKLEFLQRLVPELRKTLEEVKPGEVRRVGG